MVSRLHPLLFSFCVAVVLTGCAGAHTLVPVDRVASAIGGPIIWYGPAVADDRAAHSRWRASVGPPLVLSPPSSHHLSADEISVVSWNVALGDGDVVGFARRMRASAGRPLVLLLQEVLRRGDKVPSGARLSADAAFARRLGGASAGRAPRDIEAAAIELGMCVYYVPSMRNGGRDSNEDRGNAILADVPIFDLEAIELPFERQRRVAVAAHVKGTTAAGIPWRLRVVSAHLDNAITRRAWLGSEYGRARQARGLVALLQGEVPTVLGGDFNTWFGFSDQAYVETAHAFPQTPTSERRATFLGVLRLDHLFYRLPAGWRAAAYRDDERYGSDHAPLIGTVRFH